MAQRALPRLMLITDRRAAGEQLQARIGACVRQASPGSVVVQLRDRDAPLSWRLELGRSLRELTRESGQQLSVNDRLDLALLLEADALHLPEGGVSLEAARSLMPRAWVSRAWHAGAPRIESPEAWVVSPAMAPRKGREALGAGQLATLCNSLSSPVYALGGVDANNAASCLEAGAQGVAVIGAALDGRPVTPLLEALGIRHH